MRFPSIQVLLVAARATLVRFPWVLIAAFTAATAGILLAEKGSADEEPWIRLLLSATLGLPMLAALAVRLERKEAGAALTHGLALVGAGLLAAFFFAARSWPETTLATKYVQYSLFLHLLAAFLPYVGDREAPGFWPYNKTLFLRFLVSALFAAVLFAGLALAIAAIDQLFGVDVDEDWYFRLWMIVAFVFTTWYFLGGIPSPLSSLDDSTDYPAGLRIFSQYILAPLVGVYLLILTAYFVRVIVTWEWPSGWIGWLVSGVSVAGLLATLLVHPVKERAENKWVATFSRGFHLALLPSILMLFAAIYQRVGQYGITENRYFLIAWAGWILGIALYFTFGKRKNIRVIPTSLALIALATSFGPWGAYAVAERSQTSRLAEIFERNEMLQEGVAVASAGEVSFEDRKEIAAILRYLLERHGRESFEDWFGAERLDEIEIPETGRDSARYGSGQHAAEIMKLVDLEYVERWDTEETSRFHFSVQPEDLYLDIRGYHAAWRFHRLELPGSASGTARSVSFDPDTASFVVREEGDVLIQLPVESMLEAAREARKEAGSPNVPSAALLLQGKNERARVLVSVEWISGNRDDGLSLDGATGTVFVEYY